MPNEIVYSLAAILAYFLGSVPFGWIIVKLVKGIDVRDQGSGSIGATNVARAAGWGLFFPVILLDAFKGFAPVFLLAPWVAIKFPCPH